MRLNLQESQMIADARTQNRVHISKYPILDLLVQILIFVLVFLVISIAEGAFGSALLIPIALANPEFMQSIMQNSLQGGAAFNSESIANMTATLMSSPWVTFAMLIAAVAGVGIVILYCRVLEGRKLATIGMRRGRILREYFLGLGIGALMFAMVVGIAVACGAMSYTGLAGGALLFLLLLGVGFMVQSFSEELICRGYFMVTLAKRQKVAVAVFVSSVAFGMLHIFNSGVTFLAILNIVLFGCFAGVYMLKRGDIWGVAAVHAAWNYTQGCVFGIPVSGISDMPSILGFAPTEGLELISGGIFGLEAGLAATIVLTCALLVALLLKTRDPAPKVLAP